MDLIGPIALDYMLNVVEMTRLASKSPDPGRFLRRNVKRQSRKKRSNDEDDDGSFFWGDDKDDHGNVHDTEGEFFSRGEDWFPDSEFFTENNNNNNNIESAEGETTARPQNSGPNGFDSRWREFEHRMSSGDSKHPESKGLFSHGNDWLSDRADKFFGDDNLRPDRTTTSRPQNGPIGLDFGWPEFESPLSSADTKHPEKKGRSFSHGDDWSSDSDEFFGDDNIRSEETAMSRPQDGPNGLNSSWPEFDHDSLVTNHSESKGGFLSRGDDWFSDWFSDPEFWSEDNITSKEPTTPIGVVPPRDGFDFSDPEFDYKAILDEMLRKQWGGALFEEIDPETCEWIRESVKADGSQKSTLTTATVSGRINFHPNPSIGCYLHQHARKVLEQKAVQESWMKRWVEPIIRNMQQCWYHHFWRKSDDNFQFDSNSTTSATIKYSYFKFTCFR